MSIIKRARWKDPSGKVTDYDLGANAANVSQDSTHRFVSDTEKNNWNTKLGSTGDGSNLTSKFSQASSRTNLASGEKDSVSKGKIMKFFADLKAVAFSGSYNDLSNKPSIHSLANNCTTTAAGYGLDARQGKILQDQITQQSSELNDYKISNYESVNVSNKALNIAYSDRFININFLGLSLSEPLSANSGRNIVSNFDAYTTPNLNYITIPLVALNANNVPIGTATALVFDGTITVVTNIDLGTTDKLYGSNTKWYSEY